jgi:hypothetical protein
MIWGLEVKEVYRSPTLVSFSTCLIAARKGQEADEFLHLTSFGIDRLRRTYV